MVLEVVCPAGVSEGDALSVTSTDGITYTVTLPANVAEGQVFVVNDESAAEQPSSSDSTATPAQLAGMQQMVMEMATSFLSVALARVLQQLGCMHELHSWTEANSAAFVDYRGPDSEHLLEWTALHQEYTAMVDEGITAALQELSCSADMVFEYAERCGGDPRTDKLLAKLLAMGDYGHFCAMMHRVSVDGPPTES